MWNRCSSDAMCLNGDKILTKRWKYSPRYDIFIIIFRISMPIKKYKISEVLDNEKIYERI